MTGVVDVEEWGEDSDIPVKSPNELLDEVLEFYDCYDLLPIVRHVLWLGKVREALGNIPFHLDYATISYLVILHEEQGKKTMMESQKLQEQNRDLESRASAHR